MYEIRILIYEFHYDYIKNQYGNNSRLLFTGTNSFIYEIKTEDLYENFIKDKEILILQNILLSQNIIMIQKISGW